MAPAANRGFYVSAHNFTNGWLMAGGPLLGGLIADRLPVLGVTLPGGLPGCYFHVLLLIAVVGGVAALCVLARVPVAEPAKPQAAPAGRVIWGRVRLVWTGAVARLSNRWVSLSAVQRRGTWPSRS